LLIAVTVGVGLTVIIKVEVVPVQLFADGVMVIVPLIGVLPELVVVNDGTLPDPLAASPIEVLLLVQLRSEERRVRTKWIARCVSEVE